MSESFETEVYMIVTLGSDAVTRLLQLFCWLKRGFASRVLVDEARKTGRQATNLQKFRSFSSLLLSACFFVNILPHLLEYASRVDCQCSYLRGAVISSIVCNAVADVGLCKFVKFLAKRKSESR